MTRWRPLRRAVPRLPSEAVGGRRRPSASFEATDLSWFQRSKKRIQLDLCPSLGLEIGHETCMSQKVKWIGMPQIQAC